MSSARVCRNDIIGPYSRAMYFFPAILIISLLICGPSFQCDFATCLFTPATSLNLHFLQ